MAFCLGVPRRSLASFPVVSMFSRRPYGNNLPGLIGLPHRPNDGQRHLLPIRKAQGPPVPIHSAGVYRSVLPVITASTQGPALISVHDQPARLQRRYRPADCDRIKGEGDAPHLARRSFEEPLSLILCHSKNGSWLKVDCVSIESNGDGGQGFERHGAPASIISPSSTISPISPFSSFAIFIAFTSSSLVPFFSRLIWGKWPE